MIDNMAWYENAMICKSLLEMHSYRFLKPNIPILTR